MFDNGAATVGASTVPEQIATYISGMKRIVVSSATSPSSGMSSEKIDGDDVLEGGKICVANFVKFIPKFIELLPKKIFDTENHCLHNFIQSLNMGKGTGFARFNNKRVGFGLLIYQIDTSIRP